MVIPLPSCRPKSEPKIMNANIPTDAKVKELDTDELGSQICVNVGPCKVENRFSTNEDDMKAQVLRGACWVPASLLEVLPNQSMTIPMNSEHTTDMINNAVQYPAENLGLINEGLVKLGIKTTASSVISGFKLGQDLISFEAKMVPLPKIEYPRSSKDVDQGIKGPHSNFASWNIAHCTFAKPASLNNIHALGLDGWKKPWIKLNEGDIRDRLSTWLKHHGFGVIQGINQWARHQSTYFPKNPKTPNEATETKESAKAFEFHLQDIKEKENDLTFILLKKRDYTK
jgi:hypothetical protein